MFVILMTPPGEQEAADRTRQGLRQAGLSDDEVAQVGLRQDGERCCGLDRLREAHAADGMLLLEAGERLVGDLQGATVTGWLIVQNEAGEQRLELRLFQPEPGMQLIVEGYPTLRHPARSTPWRGRLVREAMILRESAGRAQPQISPAGCQEPLALLQAARRLHDQGRFVRAAELCRTARRMLPPEQYAGWEAAMAEALAWERAGRFEQAVQVLQAIESWHPAAAETYFRLGCCLGRLGRWQEAAATLAHCLANGEGPWYYHLSPDVAGWRAQWALAAAREALGDLQGAADLYRQSFQANPALTDALYRLAACLERLGKPEQIDASVTALLDPDDPHHWLLAADILSVHDRPRTALKAVLQTEQRLGVTQETACFRGHALFRMGRFEAARIAFERIAAHSDLYSHALTWQLHAAWADRDWPEATRLLRMLKGARLSPALRRFYPVLHRLLVDGGYFTPLPCRGRAASEMRAAWLHLLRACWQAGRLDTGGRLLLLLPLLQWPQGDRTVGLLALRVALGACAADRGRRPAWWRKLAALAEQHLAQVPEPDAEVRRGRARLALARGQPRAALALLGDAGWEDSLLRARALIAFSARLAPRSRRRPVCRQRRHHERL